MPDGGIEPDGDDECGVVIDDDICEVATDHDACEVIRRVINDEIFEDVASEYVLFDCNHDLSFLILFFLALLLFGPIMPWALAPELPELGDALAADEWLVEELAADQWLVEERVEVEDVFELDAWHSLASPPHVEDLISVEAI